MISGAILITRPRQQAKALAALLDARGIKSIMEPMTSIAAPRDANAALTQALEKPLQAIIVTSGYSLQALKPQTQQLQKIPLWVVSEATARKAAMLGFSDIHQGGGNAALMLRKIVQSHSPQQGKILYVRGTHTSLDLATALSAQGFEVEEPVIYEARAATALSEALLRSLERGDIAAATFFSRRTANIFAQLVKQRALEHSLAQVQAFCLSAPIAQTAGKLPWAGLHISRTPSQDSLLDALMHWYGQQ